MNKAITLFLALALLAASAGAQTPPTADQVLKEATAKAAAANKKVFIIFHASWCGWCHRMDSIMNNANCKKLFNDQFVIRHLTVMEAKGKEQLENAGGKALMEKYQGKNKGIPYWLIFDAQGKLVADCLIRPDGAGLDQPGENIGCPATKEEVAALKKVLKKTTTHNQTQPAVVEKNFIKEETAGSH